MNSLAFNGVAPPRRTNKRWDCSAPQDGSWNGNVSIESLASGHARSAAHDPAADAPGGRIGLDRGDREPEPAARAARAPRADRVSARPDARGPRARRGAPARAARLPST